MHTIETLQAKKAALVAQRDQLMANYNASLGAIAMVDELLGELHRAAETQKQLDQVAKDMAEESRALANEQTAGAMGKTHEPDAPVITYHEVGKAEALIIPTKPEMPALACGYPECSCIEQGDCQVGASA